MACKWYKKAYKGKMTHDKVVLMIRNMKLLVVVAASIFKAVIVKI